MATVYHSRMDSFSERRFYSIMAASMLAVSFIGFAPTYYLSNLTGAPSLDFIVHIHGIIFSAWMLLFLMQTVLVASGRRDIHQKMGIVGAALACCVVVLGVVVAIDSARSGHGPPDRNQPAFLIYPLTLMVIFAVFTALAIINRSRSEVHKRLMLLATIALTTPALARIGRMLDFPFKPPAIGGIILADIFLIALVIFDLKKFGRIHNVTLWAGGALFLSGPLRIIMSQTETWQGFARMLIG